MCVYMDIWIYGYTRLKLNLIIVSCYGDCRSIIKTKFDQLICAYICIYVYTYGVYMVDGLFIVISIGLDILYNGY